MAGRFLSWNYLIIPKNLLWAGHLACIFFSCEASAIHDHIHLGWRWPKCRAQGWSQQERVLASHISLGWFISSVRALGLYPSGILHLSSLTPWRRRPHRLCVVPLHALTGHNDMQISQPHTRHWLTNLILQSRAPWILPWSSGKSPSGSIKILG